MTDIGRMLKAVLGDRERRPGYSSPRQVSAWHMATPAASASSEASGAP